ncbi:MAG: O-antigen ligase family protein [Amphritea sp.]
MQSRISQTTIALKGDYASLDRATSGRMTLWFTALPLIEDNWINGVGARGFRYAYPKYAPTNDRFLRGEGDEKTGAYHAHQIVLEVLAETGVIGLVDYLLALVILGALVKRPCLRKNYLGMAFVASSLAVLFPLNSHLSLYASAWAQAIWILFAITVASVFSEAETFDRP